jgi:hypothetical protein
VAATTENSHSGQVNMIGTFNPRSSDNRNDRSHGAVLPGQEHGRNLLGSPCIYGSGPQHFLSCWQYEPQIPSHRMRGGLDLTTFQPYVALQAKRSTGARTSTAELEKFRGKTASAFDGKAVAKVTYRRKFKSSEMTSMFSFDSKFHTRLPNHLWCTKSKRLNLQLLETKNSKPSYSSCHDTSWSTQRMSYLQQWRTALLQT